MVALTSPPPKKHQLPSWVVRGSFACHKTAKIVLQIDRVQRHRSGKHFLLDANNERYAVDDCAPLELHHMEGTALYVYQGGELSLKLHKRTIYAWNDSIQCRIALPPLDEVDAAAESLAEAFAGAVVDGSDYSPGLAEEFPALEDG